MTPTCDHAACTARATVFTMFHSGELTFCCHHWNTLRAVAAGRTTALRVDAICRDDRPRNAGEHAADGSWPALAA